MKFAVCTNTPAAKPQVTPVTPQDITEAYEGMMTAYMELSDAQRNLDEVCQVMDNINLSMQMLKKTSDKAIECLNVDGSLEALCGIEAKLLTAEKAVESLEQEKKTAFERFKEFVLKIYKFVAEFVKNIATTVTQLLTSNKSQAEAITKATGFNMDTPAVGLLYREAFDVPIKIRNNVTSEMEKVGQTIDWLDSQENSSADAQVYQDKIREIADMCKKLAGDSQGTIVFDETSNTLKFLGFGGFINDMNGKGLLGVEGATLQSLKYSEDDLRKIAKSYVDQVYKFGTYSAKWERFWTSRLLKKSQAWKSNAPTDNEQASTNHDGSRVCLRMLVSVTLVSEQLNAAIAKYMSKYISVFFKAINA